MPYFLTTSVELGCAGFPGMPPGNVEGLMLLHRFMGHRLAAAGQLLMPLGACGELNDFVIAGEVRDLDASVAIILDVLSPVLIGFARVAWFDFREDFFRPVFPDADVFRAAGLIDRARMDSLKGHHRKILGLPFKTSF